MLAFKRSSLAASEEQDNVLSRSSRVPHPKVNRLPSPHRLRAHAPPLHDQSGEAEWGKSRLLPRGRTCGPSVAAKHRIITTSDLEENGRVSRLPWAQSRSRVAPYSRLLACIFFTALCSTRAAQIHACDISRQREQPAVLSSLVELSSLNSDCVAAIYGTPHVTDRREILSSSS